MYQTILVPLDGSKRAEAILPHVEELAWRYNAKIILLQVVHQFSMSSDFEFVDMKLYEKELNRQRKEAERYLAGLKGKLQDKAVGVKSLILFGPVVQAILDTAASENADLIAMASHGRGGLARAFYGSVAVGVLHRVDRPLLIIRAKEEG